MSFYGTITDYKERMISWIQDMVQNQRISIRWSLHDDRICTGGFVDLTDMELDIIPYNFLRVDGHFKASGNNFKSFSGFPEYIDGDLILDKHMESIEGKPKTITGRIIYK